MNLRADHPPIYAAHRQSALPGLILMAIAAGLVLIPLAMTLKGMAS